LRKRQLITKANVIFVDKNDLRIANEIVTTTKTR